MYKIPTNFPSLQNPPRNIYCTPKKNRFLCSIQNPQNDVLKCTETWKRDIALRRGPPFSQNRNTSRK